MPQSRARIRSGHVLFAACAAGLSLAMAGAAPPSPQPGAGAGSSPQPASSQASPEAREANIAWQAQDWEAAASAYGALAAAHPDNPTFAFRRAFALHSQGRYEEALEAHAVAARFGQLRGIASYNAACAAALLGRHDHAFEWLDRAFAAGFRNADQLLGDSDLSSLHDDARWTRFAEAVEQMASGHALAFWLGSWEVRDGDGVLVGTNRITSEQNGNVIREEWTDVNGRGGTSLNFLDWRTGLWRQVWVDGAGGLVEIAGRVMPDGSVVLEGERVPAPNASIPTRTTFSALSDGRVRQLIETSTDAGRTWTVGFDGYYSKVEPDLPTP